MCWCGVKFSVHSGSQDVIFIPRTVASEALLVVHGLLRYSQDWVSLRMLLTVEPHNPRTTPQEPC